MSSTKKNSILKSYRVRAGYTLQQLADITGYSYSWLSSLECGKIKVHKRVWIAIQNALGLSDDELKECLDYDNKTHTRQ